MKRPLAIAFLLIVLASLGLLGWLGIRIARDEQDVVRQRFVRVLTGSLREIDGLVAKRVQQYERELEQATDLDSLDAVTLRGNTLKDVPKAIEFGPLVPPEWTSYVPAHVTGITGTTVAGTSGAGSPCPYCTVELFLDDGDDDVEALQSLDVVTTTADGSWSAELPAALNATEGLRTASTTSDFGQIPNFEVGTTSDFSRLYPDGVTPPVEPPTPTLSGPETVPPVTYLPAPEPPPTYATVITVTSRWTDLIAMRTPESNPPPPTGTTTVSTSFNCSTISNPTVPCPAMIIGLLYG